MNQQMFTDVADMLKALNTRMQQMDMSAAAPLKAEAGDATHDELTAIQKELTLLTDRVAALLESLKLNHAILKMAHTGGWVLNKWNNQLQLKVSDELSHLLGLPDSSACNPEIFFNLITSKSDRERLDRSIQDCLKEGTPFEMETSITTPGHQEMWVSVMGLRDETSQQVWGTLRDITRYKILETQLATLTQNIPGAIFKYILHPDSTNEIQQVGNGSYLLWGADPKAVMADSSLAWSTVHPDDVPGLAKSIEESAASLTTWNYEWRVNHPTKGLRWHRGTGNPARRPDGGIEWYSVLLDVTEEKNAVVASKKAEEEARYMERLMVEAQRLSRMGSWNYDFNHDRLTWTDALYDVFDVEKTTFKEKYSSFLDFIVPEDRDFVQRTSLEAQRTGQPFNVRYRIKTPKGELRIIEEYGYSEKNEQDKIFRLFGTAQDITAKVRREQQLKLMESAVTSASDAVMVLRQASVTDDPRQAIVEFLNEAFYTITGYGADQVLNKPFSKFLADISNEAELAAIEKAMLSKASYLGTILKSRNSYEHYWLEISINPVFDEYSRLTHWVAIGRDTTKDYEDSRRKALQSSITSLFSQSKTLHEILADVMHFLREETSSKLAEVWMLDYEKQNFQIIATSFSEKEGMEDLRKHLSHFNRVGINHPISIELIKKKSPIVQMLEEEESLSPKNMHRKSAGIKSVMRIPLLYNDEVIGVFALSDHKSSYELSSIKRVFTGLETYLGTEIKRKQYEEELNLLFTTTPDIIVIADSEGCIKRINPSAVRLLGYKEEELLTMCLSKMVVPEAVTRVEKMMADLVVSNAPVFLEAEFCHQDGHTLWLSISASYSRADQLIFAVAKDIDQQKKAEAQLEGMNVELNLKAKELSKSNEELEQFAYIASHDMQEPLRTVSSFLTLLESRYADKLDQKGLQYIRFAVDGAKRMRQIIIDLLEFSRIGKSNEITQELDLTEIVNQAIALQSRIIADKNATIVVENLPVMIGLRTPVTQVFQNLLNNALKYSKPDVKPVITIRGQEEENDWVISVADNGIGIGPAFFDKIFVIFQRLHTLEEFGGTGIGLAVVKKIIEQWGGKIWVHSEEGNGSTFYFTIPKSLISTDKSNTAKEISN